MSFQSSIQIRQGFGVPGEVFQDVPWTVLSYTLNSSGTPNIVGATAYTITGDGPDGYPQAQAGSGGTAGFAGILAIPKDYALTGVDGDSLSPTLEIPDEAQAEIVSQGMMVIQISGAASVGDHVIYDNTTGALSAIAPGDIIPSGYSSANAIISQFSKGSFSAGLAVILIIPCCADSGASTWPYVDTYWLASNGQDTLPGNSQDLPLGTLLGLDALLTTTPTIVNIVDNGTYDLPSTFTVSCPLIINAPGATINWTGADSGLMFYLNTNSPLTIIAANITNNGANIFNGFSSIFCTCPLLNMSDSVSRRVWEDATVSPGGVPKAIFNIGTSPFALAEFLFGYAGEQVINATHLGEGQIYSNLPSGTNNGQVLINADYFDGSLAGSADYTFNVNYLGGDFEYTSTGILNQNVGKANLDMTMFTYNGIVNSNPLNTDYPGNLFNNPLYLFQQPVIGEIYHIVYASPASPTVWSFSPAVQNGNTAISIPQNAANGTIILPDGSTVPYGWRIHFIQTVSSGAAVQLTGANDTLNGQNNVGPGATSCYTGIGTGKFVRGAANGSGGFDWAVENCFTSN